MKKYDKAFNTDTFHLDWVKIYLLPSKVTLHTRLREFQCKILNRIFYTNEMLFKVAQNSLNRPRSIYQYSSMAPRLSGKNCKFFKFLLFLNSQERLRYKENNTKYGCLTRKPRSHIRILIYQTWPIINHKGKRICFS